jgi:hypothetical protein
MESIGSDIVDEFLSGEGEQSFAATQGETTGFSLSRGGWQAIERRGRLTSEDRRTQILIAVDSSPSLRPGST